MPKAPPVTLLSVYYQIGSRITLLTVFIKLSTQLFFNFLFAYTFFLRYSYASNSYPSEGCCFRLTVLAYSENLKVLTRNAYEDFLEGCQHLKKNQCACLQVFRSKNKEYFR